MLGKKQKVGENNRSVDSQIDHDNDELKTKNEATISFEVTFELEYWEKIWKIEQALCDELNKLNFKSDKNIGAIYNPLEYADDVHKNYMRKYLRKSPTIVFLGMNPGLYGMCQTSVSYSINECKSTIYKFSSFTGSIWKRSISKRLDEDNRSSEKTSHRNFSEANQRIRLYNRRTKWQKILGCHRGVVWNTRKLLQTLFRLQHLSIRISYQFWTQYYTTRNQR